MADASPAGRTRAPAHDLTRGPITRTLLLFSLPTLGANVVHALNGSINAVWVGQLLGETALTATVSSALVLFFLLSAVFGFGMAVTILIGQNIGRGDVRTARRVAGTGMILFLMLGVVIAALGWVFAGDLLRLMRTPEPAFPLALIYMRIIFLGLPPLYMFIYLGMVLRGGGDARTPFIFILIGALIDVALNPVLILGLFGMPRLGIAGSGWAMAISQVVGLAATIAYVYARDLPMRLRGSEFAYLKPDPILLRAIISKGLPMGLYMVVVSLSGLVMIYFVNQHGVKTAAAYGVMVQIWGYLQMPAMAVGAAVSVMAAQNIGAGLWSRVGRITIAGAAVNIVLTSALLLAALLFERPLMRFFLPYDAEAIELARHINHLVSWAFVILGVTMVIFSTVRATGAVIAPLWIMFIALFPCRVGFILLFEDRLGADAIWWSLPLGVVVALVMAAVYYRRGSWRQMRMVGDTKPHGEAVIPQPPAALEAVPSSHPV